MTTLISESPNSETPNSESPDSENPYTAVHNTKQRSATTSAYTGEIKADSIKKAASFIASQQLSSGAIPWFKNGKLDPWDHTEAAMGLSVAGLHKQAKAAYVWLAENQLRDGSWHAQYFTEDVPPLKETNFIAYIATGVWHHFAITQDHDFLQNLFPSVEKAITFVLQQQSPEGDIAWAVDANNQTQHDALVTACSSILRSIECAIFCAQALQKPTQKWRECARALKQALLLKPFRFDRTWESKARFAMDWYYPILAGIHSPKDAQHRLQKRWEEFVKPKLGCRCVNDEPWVTMAETSELVMALEAANMHEEALKLFATLQQWQTKEGGYWTGYVFKDDTLWPDEITTWTAGAVILAWDALHRHTRASNLFIRPCAI